MSATFEVPKQAFMGGRIGNAQPGAGAIHGLPLDRCIESFDMILMATD